MRKICVKWRNGDVESFDLLDGDEAAPWGVIVGSNVVLSAACHLDDGLIADFWVVET
jgi:hypothetical protein